MVLQAITPSKDVDGLHPANVAALCTGRTRAPGALKDLDFHVPCTPQVIHENIKVTIDNIMDPLKQNTRNKCGDICRCRQSKSNFVTAELPSFILRPELTTYAANARQKAILSVVIVVYCFSQTIPYVRVLDDADMCGRLTRTHATGLHRAPGPLWRGDRGEAGRRAGAFQHRRHAGVDAAPAQRRHGDHDPFEDRGYRLRGE